MLAAVLAEFDDLERGETIKFNNPNEIKLASKGESCFGPENQSICTLSEQRAFSEFSLGIDRY